MITVHRHRMKHYILWRHGPWIATFRVPNNMGNPYVYLADACREAYMQLREPESMRGPGFSWGVSMSESMRISIGLPLDKRVSHIGAKNETKKLL